VNTARSLVVQGRRNQRGAGRARARAALPLAEEVTKILVTHHPFDVPADSHDDDQIVGRARMALEALAHCGADVFLAGHLHETTSGTPRTATASPASPRSWCRPATTLSTRSRAARPTAVQPAAHLAAPHRGRAAVAWQAGRIRVSPRVPTPSTYRRLAGPVGTSRAEPTPRALAARPSRSWVWVSFLLAGWLFFLLAWDVATRRAAGPVRCARLGLAASSTLTALLTAFLFAVTQLNSTVGHQRDERRAGRSGWRACASGTGC
jgi:hypothetical protein